MKILLSRTRSCCLLRAHGQLNAWSTTTFYTIAIARTETKFTGAVIIIRGRFFCYACGFRFLMNISLKLVGKKRKSVVEQDAWYRVEKLFH